MIIPGYHLKSEPNTVNIFLSPDDHWSLKAYAAHRIRANSGQWPFRLFDETIRPLPLLRFAYLSFQLFIKFICMLAECQSCHNSRHKITGKLTVANHCKLLVSKWLLVEPVLFPQVLFLGMVYSFWMENIRYCQNC